MLPDYHADFPRTCMDGWGQRYLVVAPDGTALPCQAAHTIRTLRFENVRDRPLGEIWHHSAGLPGLPGRGLDEPHLPTCDRRSLDLGRLPLPGLPAHRRRQPPPIRSARARPTTRWSRRPGAGGASRRSERPSLRYRRLPTVA